MATVIAETPPDTVRLHHNMIASPASIQQQQHHHHHQHHQRDHPRDASPYRAAASRSHTFAHRPHQSSLEQRTSTLADTESLRRPSAGAFGEQAQPRPHPAAAAADAASTDDGASRIPSPPSSSPAASVGLKSAADDATPGSMASQTSSVAHPAVGLVPPSSSRPPPSQLQQQQPSPPNDDFQIPHDASRLAPPADADTSTQTVIHIRDLAHIQTLAKADLLGTSGSSGGILNDPPLQQMKYEISGMPIGDVIEMVAALLTKITTTNDLQHDAMQRNAVHQQQAGQSGESSGSAQMSPLSHSVLAFHGKNVPGITILSYLSRIHKYCPTTYEVFLSLLVYFDRMTERVNDMVTRSEETRRRAASQSHNSRPTSQHHHPHDTPMTDKPESLADSDETDSDLADDDNEDDDDDEMVDSSGEPSRAGSSKVIDAAPPADQSVISGPATYFVVDSFNIHRLIIAGVTCASKFFSDVFYTNSRYAKVGGLPLAELNHLELQFLILNDFRLAVPVEDLEAYATMLVEFYARDVVASKAAARGA